MVVPLGADETLMTLVGAVVRGMIGYVWKPIWSFHDKVEASNQAHWGHCPSSALRTSSIVRNFG